MSVIRGRFNFLTQRTIIMVIRLRATALAHQRPLAGTHPLKAPGNPPKMTAMNKAAPQIVRAPAPAVASPATRAQSDIRELLGAMASEHASVQSDTHHLETLSKYKQRLGLLRQDKKADSLVGKLISSQEDKVQDAQIELNKSMGRLAQKFLELWTLNTSMTEVQGAQQGALQEQQNSLRQQGDKLKDQHQKLLEQQKTLKQHQDLIQTANQGLMEAQGITQEQAQQLVGCVRQVTQAEQKLAAANLLLRAELEHNVREAVQQCLDQLTSGFAELEQRHGSFAAQITSQLLEQSLQTSEQLALLGSASADFQAGMAQKWQQNVQSVQEQIAAQHAMLLQQQEASRAQLNKIQRDLLQDLMATLQHKAMALHETVNGLELTLQTTLQQERRFLQAQCASFESGLQGLNLDLKGYVDAIHTLDRGLSHNAGAVSTLQQQLHHLQTEQRTVQRRYRWGLAAVASMATLSLGWQMAKHFAGF